MQTIQRSAAADRAPAAAPAVAASPGRDDHPAHAAATRSRSCGSPRPGSRRPATRRWGCSRFLRRLRALERAPRRLPGPLGGREKIAMSLLSLRTETMSDSLAKKIGRIRKTGFTLAPEAATERMRAVINKAIARRTRSARSTRVPERLVASPYFMIGPDERDEDVVAIGPTSRGGARTARRALPKGEVRGDPPRGLDVRAEAVHALPVGADDLPGGDPSAPGAHHRRARRASRRDPVQAACTRASRRSRARSRSATGAAATAVLAAYRSGQRLDGWSEWFDEGRWLAAFDACERARSRARLVRALSPPRRGPALGRIDCGVTKPYLVASRPPGTWPRWRTASSPRAASAARATTRSSRTDS